MRYLHVANLFIVPAIAVWFIYGIGAGTIHADTVVWMWAFLGLFSGFVDSLKGVFMD